MDILALPYGKMLVLGAISAASAFVVTILIVLVCVGCHTKSKSKHSHASVGSQKRDMMCVFQSVLRQFKLSSMSKSDTRLHEMHRLPCSANGVLKDRPASMDLLLLQSHRSTSDPHPPTSSCQLPSIPTGPKSEEHDHLYLEDEGLYEKVGVLRAPPPPPFLNLAQSQAITENRQGTGGGGVENRGLNETEQAEVTAEYASVKKVRKLDRGRRQEGSEEENTSESSNSTVHRKSLDPFHIPNFPKISEMYSTVCKPLKKEHLGSTQQISGQIGSGEKGSKGPASWPSGEHCYEAVGENTWPKGLDSDEAYATINPMPKREKPCSSTLKAKKKSCGPLQGLERAMTCENFYESIGDVKQGTNTTSTTTVFTFNDGMEMYVTGL
ncbi:lck-interacting transmembrane adapter 1 isoform X3 [Neoarius graeffei]|uniref:lck-interacting transmembrane adapter 1 isoform X3 n=1 Tax=Neoarius graeffei TaxID=443677 RepID=UPI00298BF370|nr:lck-interacting transmembrane adapter 1 isoform X3 [Neoarius graeffei]